MDVRLESRIGHAWPLQVKISVEALQAPTKDSLDAWLNTPRLAKCGKVFTPAEPMWKPDQSANHSVNWKAAVACVSLDWQPWLHAALAYRMADVSADTVFMTTSVLSRAAHAGIDPLNGNHLIALPRKKNSSNDVILSLDPEQGPFTQVEQDGLDQWIHEQFCHGQLDPEQYLYLRMLMIYGQRGVQVRMMVFGDFTKSDQGCKVRFHWAKQRWDEGGWRVKFETFSLDDDLYSVVQAYKAMVLAQLWQTYPEGADWNAAIQNVPLFRRKLVDEATMRDRFNPPVLLDSHLQKSLEDAPQAIFHTGKSTINGWLERSGRMEGFPISPRTHQPLIVTRGCCR